jgi:hypothetical protein
LNELGQMERRRSDKLLVAYTRLRTRCEALTKELAKCGSARAAGPEESPAGEPPRRAKMFSLVSDPDKGTRGDDS